MGVKCTKCLIEYEGDPAKYFYPTLPHKNKRGFASYCITCERKINSIRYAKKVKRSRVGTTWSIRKRLAFHAQPNAKTGCIEWTGGFTGKYGYLTLWKKKYSVHRLAYEIANEPITNDLWVLHTCDNPPCINPKHLFLGTRQDNIDDMVRKGRHKYGKNKAQKRT